MIFPTVGGENLSGQTYILPYGLEGEFNLLMIAFEPAQQFLVRTWLPLLGQLADQYTHFRYYQLPTLNRFGEDRRTFIDQAMRRGISDPNLRDQVITLYLDKAAFCQTLNIRGESTIYLLLIDHEGIIHWRTEGIATQHKKDDLATTVERLFQNQDTFPWEI
ncbi:MAG: hypothetical protein H7Y11_15460 [Armatimonadetes bacterium]|nr:hypothetical protein [Anaerolineae bacterium]